MSAAMKLAFGFLAVLVIIALIQGATLHKIGAGPLTVEFGDRGTPGQPQPGRASPGPTEDAGSGGGGGGSPAKSVRGSWTAARGDLTLTVTQVEDQDGHLRLRMKAANDGSEALELPLFGNFSATDDTGRTYQPSMPDSDWNGSVPAGQAISGVVELTQRRAPSARRLNASFSVIYGFGSPSGSITVRGVQLP